MKDIFIIPFLKYFLFLAYLIETSNFLILQNLHIYDHFFSILKIEQISMIIIIMLQL
jgi:hypothetical protein